MSTKFYRIIEAHVPGHSGDPGGPRIVVADEDTVQEISVEEAQRLFDSGSAVTVAAKRQLQ